MEFFISFSLFMHGIIPGRKQSLLEEESIFGCKVRKKKNEISEGFSHFLIVISL